MYVHPHSQALTPFEARRPQYVPSNYCHLCLFGPVWNLRNGKQAQARRNFAHNIYQCPIVLSILPPLGHLSLSAHPKMHISVQMLSSSFHVSVLIHISNAENTQFSGFVDTETTTCYATLLCLAVDSSGSFAHFRAREDTSTGALFLPLAHTQANPERGLFLAHINVSNQSGQGAL